MSRAERRARLAFGVWNAIGAVVLLSGVFLVVQPRFWGLDVPLAAIALVQAVSAVALLTNRAWAERALSIAAWAGFVLGLAVLSAVVLSMVFLRGIHGD